MVKAPDTITITPVKVTPDSLSARAAIVKVPADSILVNKPAKADTLVKNTVPSDASVKWPVDGPEPLPGAILPKHRIIAFYGNQLSKRMGILGELPPDEMLAQLDREVEAWRQADPGTPVLPALHVIVVTAQGAPGKDEKYRLRMSNWVAEQVMEWAETRNAIVFLDVQVGHSTLQEELPRLEPFLKNPKVHLGVDAEFSMKNGGVPGERMGTFDAEDINYATTMLADIVTKYQLPPKLLIVHRFTDGMITNSDKIERHPNVQIVMHMDGWGSAALKKNTYHRYIYKQPVQYTGFKLFYKNDTRNGWAMMKPEEVLALYPKPLYIQYQ